MVAALRRRFGPAADTVYVFSAGLKGPAGAPMQEMAEAELRKRSVEPGRFTSRLLRIEDARHAHLVLTATRRQRDEVARLDPGVLRAKTFTWRELAWLLDGVPPGELAGRSPIEQIAGLPAFVAERRGYLRPPAPEALDVADPMGGSRKDYRLAAAQIDEAIATVISALGPASPPGR